MEIELTPDQKTRLDQLAAQKGRSAVELIREAIDRYLADDVHFATAVTVGIEAAERGDFVAAEEVWARAEQALQS
jgi:predicted transcriptional regulator